MFRIALTVGLIFLILLSMVTPGYSEGCRGDIDGSGVVDGSDLMEIASDYGRADCPIKTVKYIVCEGELTSGGRWCNNGDGTVTDMTTGLVWLKDASWGGLRLWLDPYMYEDAHTRTGILRHGMDGAGLSDGSVEGDWRLPTKSDLVRIMEGAEAVSSVSPHQFTGIQPSYYWSSTTVAYDAEDAWLVNMYYGSVFNENKDFYNYVWPVRGGNW